MRKLSKNILEVKGLETSFISKKGEIKIIEDLQFSIERGSVLGVVGKTGSGKSITAMSFLGLLDQDKVIVKSHHVRYLNEDHAKVELNANEKNVQSELRAKEIAIIFQNPRNALDSVRKCGKQIARIIKKHSELDKEAIQQKVKDLFTEVGLEDHQRIYNSFPHQLSGGELQRVLIALSLSCDPKLLVLDEPTSSLDLIVQKKILDLLVKLKEKRNLSMMFISHNLPLISQVSDHIMHIDDGHIVSYQSTKEFFENPQSEVSRKLIAQLATNLEDKGFVLNISKKKIIDVHRLTKTFTRRKMIGKELKFVALDDVSFEIHEGDSLGVVGESGSGKSTLAKCVAGLITIDSGTINTQLSAGKAIYVFQDSYSSMDPQLTIYEILNEVARIHLVDLTKLERDNHIVERIKAVGLDERFLNRRTNQISGGQRQRINLCRALLAEPELLICDEITTGLDLIVQFEIINLLKEIASNLTLVFISHDISLIKMFCNQILIMKSGKIVERGATNEIFENPKHKYTSELINSIVKVKYFLNT